MTTRQFLKAYESLPSAAQRKVQEYVASLVQRVKKLESKGTNASTQFGPGDPVFGLWRTRKDMTDSAAWIKALRREQWARRDG